MSRLASKEPAFLPEVHLICSWLNEGTTSLIEQVKDVVEQLKACPNAPQPDNNLIQNPNLAPSQNEGSPQKSKESDDNTQPQEEKPNTDSNTAEKDFSTDEIEENLFDTIEELLKIKSDEERKAEIEKLVKEIEAKTKNGKNKKGKSSSNSKPRNSSTNVKVEKESIHIEHPTLSPGDRCSCCEKGKLYEAACARSTQYEIKVVAIEREVTRQNLRCSGCQTYFTAPCDPKLLKPISNETAAFLTELNLVGGMPYHRTETLLKLWGLNISKSVIFRALSDTNDISNPILESFKKELANAGLFIIDDTRAKIIEVSKRPQDPNAKKGQYKEPDKRLTAITSIILAYTKEGIPIGALYITSTKNCGENLEDLLKFRTSEEPCVVLSDMSSSCDTPSYKESKKAAAHERKKNKKGQKNSNPIKEEPKKPQYIKAACNDHAFRKIRDLADENPILKPLVHIYQQIYIIEAAIQGIPLDLKLKIRLEDMKPLFEKLLLLAKFLMEHPDPSKRIEPNSIVGKALQYFIKYFDYLTLFLSMPGVPISNAPAERGLKKIIIKRKNSYFHLTEAGAEVTANLASIIETCRLLNQDPREFLLAVLDNADDVAKNPEKWTVLAYVSRKLSSIKAS
jgi:transposase